MAYSNNNASFYSSAFGEFYTYPPPGRMLATGGADIHTHHTLADHLGTVEWPGPVAGSSANLRVTANDSVASATPYTTRVDGYGQPSYTEYHWPAVGHRAESHRSGYLSRDASFTSTVESEASTVVPTPSSFPFDHWGDNQSGPSNGTFYENVQQFYQPSTGPARTGLTSTGRFQPYGMSRARTSEHRNAEAGPSTLVPPPTPYAGPSTSQPSGGSISETTANAATKQTITEEAEVPGSKGTRRPRGQGPARLYRIPPREDATKLCEWVQGREKLPEAPSLNRALAVAVRIIPTIRPLVNLQPCLLKGHGRRIAVGSKNADDEFKRRNVERELLQELSRYYPLGPKRKAWHRPQLLSLVWKDLEALPAPAETSNVSLP